MSQAVAHTGFRSAAVPAELRSLYRRFKGTLIQPAGNGWEAATQAFNLTVVQEPMLFAIPEDEEDVAAVVEYARLNGLQVAGQPVGHDAEPLGGPHAVVLLKTDA